MPKISKEMQNKKYEQALSEEAPGLSAQGRQLKREPLGNFQGRPNTPTWVIEWSYERLTILRKGTELALLYTCPSSTKLVIHRP
jgi:hypothetical protein